MYRVRFMEAAEDDLSRLDRSVIRRLTERIRWLAENLDDVRRESLVGDLAGLFKLRVGDYRVIYQVLRDEETLVIHALGHRRDIYRKR